MDLIQLILWVEFLYHLKNVIVVAIYALPLAWFIWLCLSWYGQWQLNRETIRLSRENSNLDIVERKIKIAFLAHPQAADMKELDQLLNEMFEQKRLKLGDDESLFVRAFQVGRKVNEMCKVQERLAQAKATVTQIVIGE